MSATLSAAEIARRMSPEDQPDLITEEFVRRRMSSRRWPSTKLGRFRVMTESQFQQALDIEAVSAHQVPGPRPSGVSPRSRMKREVA